MSEDEQMEALDEMIEEAAPGNARRRAFDQMVQREKALAEALGEPSIEITQDGIEFRATEAAGDVRFTVTDLGDGEDVGPEEQVRVELPPLGAEALGTGLIELARVARGEEPREYSTRPSSQADIRDQIAAGTPIDRLNVTAYSEHRNGLQAVAEFLEAVKDIGLKVTGEYGSAVISRPMTEAERDEALRREQARWDETREEYEKAAELALMPKDHGVRVRVEKFCKAEGLPLPWDRPHIGDLR